MPDKNYTGTQGVTALRGSGFRPLYEEIVLPCSAVFHIKTFFTFISTAALQSSIFSNKKVLSISEHSFESYP